MSYNFMKVRNGIYLGPQVSEPMGSGLEGMIYYNSALNKFRKFENGQWKDLSPDPSIYNAVAGENLTANDQVYMSTGTGGDSGRTAGRIYKVDATNVSRINVLGFAESSASTGGTLNIRLSGTMPGFSSLTKGLAYYSSPTTPGAITTTIPTTTGQYIIPSATAYSATELVINPLSGSQATYIAPFYTSFTIDNNISVATDVTGITFDYTTTKGFIINYVIRRSATSSYTQIGELRGIYNTTTSAWYISDDFSGQDAGVTFSITTAGQLQYISTDVSGGGYIGTLEYNIKNTANVSSAIVNVPVTGISNTLLWDSVTVYFLGSLVTYNGVIYKSLANSNLNNAVTDKTKWVMVSAPQYVTTLTGTTTLATDTHTIILANASSAAFTLNLPTAASSYGKNFKIKKIDTTLNKITLTPNGADLIDGLSSFQVQTYLESIEVVSNGSAWYIL